MRVHEPDRQLMKEHGYGQVAHVPFLLADDGSYLREPNRYLRERALLEWLPEDATATSDAVVANSPCKKLSYPTVKTLMTMAAKLINFLMWCASKPIDWRAAEYTRDIVNGYQADMKSGVWSKKKKPLGGRTINQRGSEATLFLTWSEQSGYRSKTAPAFRVPRRKVKRPGSSGESSRKSFQEHDTRAGKANVAPQLFFLPEPENVANWLRRIYLNRGRVKGLCSELILETAIRVTECISWRVDVLDKDPSKWKVRGGEVHVIMSAGTKGSRSTPTDVDGPQRVVKLPIALANKLHAYRMNERESQLARWIRAAKTSEERLERRRSPEPERLFLGERSNRPFSARLLGRVWSTTPGCGEGWSPHKGRHYCACQKLIEITIEKAKAADCRLSNLNPDWLSGALSNDITIVIRPLLGHVSEETTNIYLEWLRTWFAAQTGTGPLRWQDYLEGDSL